MLNSALDNAGLTDAWIQRHGHSTTYRTWEERKEGENPVWTSPDHILISKNQAGRVSAIQVDDATTRPWDGPLHGNGSNIHYG